MIQINKMAYSPDITMDFTNYTISGTSSSNQGQAKLSQLNYNARFSREELNKWRAGEVALSSLLLGKPGFPFPAYTQSVGTSKLKYGQESQDMPRSTCRSYMQDTDTSS